MRRRSSFLIAGISFGLAQYFYASSRFLLGIIPLWLIFTFVIQRRRLIGNRSHLLVFFTAFVVAVLPLALFYQQNPGDFAANGDYIAPGSTNDQHAMIRLPVAQWEGPDKAAPRWDWTNAQAVGPVVVDQYGWGSPRSVTVGAALLLTAAGVVLLNWIVAPGTVQSNGGQVFFIMLWSVLGYAAFAGLGWVRIAMADAKGHSVFGDLDQTVEPWSG